VLLYCWPSCGDVATLRRLLLYVSPAMCLAGAPALTVVPLCAHWNAIIRIPVALRSATTTAHTLAWSVLPTTRQAGAVMGLGLTDVRTIIQ
jgi:hypothetical protein